MYRFAQRQTGMTWSEIREQLTGESLTIQAITSHQTDQSVDFVELFNPGNFKEQKSSLVAGGTYDVHGNPAIDLTRDSVREQVRKDIEMEDPLIVLGAPPCTVFSPMQNINQKDHIGDAWEKKNRNLAPHRDIQNHRHFRNATISFGKWEGGVLQTYEDDIWVNQDSRDEWVILDARDTFHRVTPVEGDRVSIIYHTP